LLPFARKPQLTVQTSLTGWCAIHLLIASFLCALMNWPMRHFFEEKKRHVHIAESWIGALIGISVVVLLIGRWRIFYWAGTITFGLLFGILSIKTSLLGFGALLLQPLLYMTFGCFLVHRYLCSNMCRKAIPLHRYFLVGILGECLMYGVFKLPFGGFLRGESDYENVYVLSLSVGLWFAYCVTINLLYRQICEHNYD